MARCFPDKIDRQLKFVEANLSELKARTSGSLGLVTIGMILWFGVGAAETFLDSDASQQILILSWMTVLFSGWVFLKHGGPYITAAGTWSLCSGLFVGFAGFYWHGVNPNDPAMARAVGVAFLTHAAMYYCFWQGRNLRAPEATGGVEPKALNGFFPVGFSLLAIGAILARRGIAETVANHAAFVGIILLVLAVILGGRRRFKVIPLIFTAGLGAFYLKFVFVGFGRIVLATLALSIVMALAVKYRTRWIKIAVIVALPPALTFLVKQREQFGLSEYGQALDGIGSVVEPLRQFSVMLSQPQWYEHAFGSTFWAAAVTHVPRSLWESKPDGFGLEIAWLYNPTLASIGGTLAALSHGEWIYNFGALGLVMMVIFIGLAIRIADTGFLRIVSAGLKQRRDSLALATLLIIGSGMTDLLWGGTHTFMGRDGTRLLIILALFLVWGWSRALDHQEVRPVNSHTGSRGWTKSAPMRASLRGRDAYSASGAGGSESSC